MIARAATFTWLLGVWLVLLESTTPGAVAVGLGVAGALTFLVRPPGSDDLPQKVRIRPLHLVLYLATFVGLLTWANLLVAWAVIAPRRAGVNRAVVRVPIAPMPDAATMILANAISLTPGTFILEITRDPTIFYVHVLQFSSVPEVLEDLWGLQRRLARALGLDEAVVTIDEWREVLHAEGPEAVTGHVVREER